ncbi:hypothetical protein LINPERPRIM_LOCUS32628 [Linum perenne]
MMLQRKMD